MKRQYIDEKDISFRNVSVDCIMMKIGDMEYVIDYDTLMDLSCRGAELLDRLEPSNSGINEC